MSFTRSFNKKNYGFYKIRFVWNRAAYICFNFAMHVINANESRILCYITARDAQIIAF